MGSERRRAFFAGLALTAAGLGVILAVNGPSQYVSFIFLAAGVYLIGYVGGAKDAEKEDI